ncbi:MAG: outer membrane protein assembly factor BamD [Candidatus Omnitrophica bacterium]|nr:outer membrane protein assembly factor BamD [Candidatus Omnitrophota bacterium]
MYFLRILVFIFLLSFFAPGVREGLAFWVWTPETNRWVNPKYAVKDTPAEQLEFALGFYKGAKCKEAIQELRKLITHYPRAREAADAQYYIGVCQQAMGNPQEAFKSYQEVVDKYPFSERSAEIVKKQYDIAVGMMEGKDKQGLLAKTLSGADYAIVDMFKAVIKNAPYGDLAAPSRYKIGLYLLGNGLYQEARDEFEKAVNDYPESEWARAAKYQIAICDAKRSTDAPYDQKTTQEASKEFNDFVKNYPDAELSDNARKQIQTLKDKEAESNFHIAQFYEKTQRYSSALIYYQTVVDDFQNSKWAVEALKKIQELSRKVQ